MAVTVWQYPKCSTCRKALGWLAAHDVAVDSRDIVVTPPPIATLRELLRRSGLPIARFFNTSGESYRAGGFKDRLKSMSDAAALAALAADGKLIKRPLVDADGRVLVGFDETAYAAAFGGGRAGHDARTTTRTTKAKSTAGARRRPSP